jgi:hypothetical protein
MPRQRKPDVSPEAISTALNGESSSAFVRNLLKQKINTDKGKKKKKNKTQEERVIEAGDRTTRPMLPEELRGMLGNVEESQASKNVGTIEGTRDTIYKMTQERKTPSWMFDLGNSRVNYEGSDKEELRLKKAEENLVTQEVFSLRHQSQPIRTNLHPPSCKCGKGGEVCGQTQTADGYTSRLPQGLTKKEEDLWLSNEAADRGIDKEVMRDWYEEQKSPSPVRISGEYRVAEGSGGSTVPEETYTAPDKDAEASQPTGHPAAREPEESHYLLSQFDHDPREQCDAHGRNPIGHVVHIWNHDGSIPGLPRGLNIGLIVGRAPRSDSTRKRLSGDILAQHDLICREGVPESAGKVSCKEGCPVKFHDDNCRGGEHAEGCQIPEGTITGGYGSGNQESLYKVITWRPVSPDEMQKRFRSKIDFSSLDAPSPEWKPTGIQGLQGSIVVPSSRCIHVPDAAIPTFLRHSRLEGKRDARNYFGDLGGLVGPRSVLLTHHIYFPNPLAESNSTKNRTLPGFATVMDQLETAGPEGPEGVAEGFVPGKPTETKVKKPTSTSFAEDILRRNSSVKPVRPNLRRSFTHVNEQYKQTPSCRFCEDASYKDGKGPIVQTGVSPDGRPLYAHEECDNPFSFAETFKFDFGGPNPVDVDFISLGSHNWGMQYQNDARKVFKELGIETPSRGINPVNNLFSRPGNRKEIGSMGLPEHKNAEGMVDEEPITQVQVDNLNSNGTAKPPK